jgi:diadenosine tetraphosphate (Ap4A) HIT family hydrolase
MPAQDLPEWKRDPIGTAERGENPTAILRMRSGFAVMGWQQFLPGYALLLGIPKFARLEDMPRAQRAIFLEDMGLLGEAVAKVCNPLRMNYSIYGNTDAYVHAYVFPRYDWEPAERITRPVWQYPPEMWTDPAHDFDEAEHGELKNRIAETLRSMM